MRVDKPDDGLIHSGTLRVGTGILFFVDRAVDLKEQIADQKADTGRSAKTVLVDLIEQAEQSGTHLVAFNEIEMIDIFMCGNDFLQQIHVIRRFSHQFGGEGRTDPQDESTVGKCRIRDIGAVPDPGRNDSQIPLFQRKAAAIDLHGHLAFDKEIEFIVVVAVDPDALEHRIGIIENFEILG